jgi:hypothetical protein
VLATELIDAMLDAAASAILSHKRVGTVELPDRPASDARAEDVTIRHYSLAQRPPLKKQGMLEWLSRLAEAKVRADSREESINRDHGGLLDFAEV